MHGYMNPFRGVLDNVGLKKNVPQYIPKWLPNGTPHETVSQPLCIQYMVCKRRHSAHIVFGALVHEERALPTRTESELASPPKPVAKIYPME